MGSPADASAIRSHPCWVPGSHVHPVAGRVLLAGLPKPQHPHPPSHAQVIWENFTLDTEKADNEEILTVEEVTVTPVSV